MRQHSDESWLEFLIRNPFTGFSWWSGIDQQLDLWLLWAQRPAGGKQTELSDDFFYSDSGLNSTLFQNNRNWRKRHFVVLCFHWKKHQRIRHDVSFVHSVTIQSCRITVAAHRNTLCHCVLTVTYVWSTHPSFLSTQTVLPPAGGQYKKTQCLNSSCSGLLCFCFLPHQTHPRVRLKSLKLHPCFPHLCPFLAPQSRPPWMHGEEQGNQSEERGNEMF